MIYLASPYSHPDEAVRQQRYELACEATAKLCRWGHVVFSPIVHSHPLVQYGLPTDWEFWSWYDREFIKCCDELVVLQLDGWEDSAGVANEQEIAMNAGKVVRFQDMNLLYYDCEGVTQGATP